MKSIIKLATGVLFLIVLVGCGESKPSKSDYQRYFKQHAKKLNVDVAGIKIIAQENIGDSVQPNWKGRILVSFELIEDQYMVANTIQASKYDRVKVVKPFLKKGLELDFEFITSSNRFGETWKVNHVKAEPANEDTRAFMDFSGRHSLVAKSEITRENNVVIIESDDHKLALRAAEEFKQREAERKAKYEAEQAEKRRIAAEAKAKYQAYDALIKSDPKWRELAECEWTNNQGKTIPCDLKKKSTIVFDRAGNHGMPLAEAGYRFRKSSNWNRKTPYSFSLSNVKFRRNSLDYASNGRKSKICSAERISMTPAEFLDAEKIEFVCIEESADKRDGEIRIRFPLIAS